jgi:E3 ubiquitin-protein ligase HUWE1
MLYRFVACNGQKAFFDIFEWALTQGGKVPIEQGLEHPDLPEGTGEFLECWLLLLEKMVNPKMVLESPYVVPRKLVNNEPFFDPLRYLIQIHKKAFTCIMHLWNRKPLKMYGEGMSDSMLSILCHLLRGEQIIADRLAKERAEQAAKEQAFPPPAASTANAPATTAASTASTTTSASREVRSTNPAAPVPQAPAVAPAAAAPARPAGRNEAASARHELHTAQLDQLVDMGFSREHALEAIVQTNSLEQATEYLLNRPANADWEMNEDDQMLQAIAMSLGVNSAGEPQAPAQQNAATASEQPETVANQQTQPLALETLAPTEENQSTPTPQATESNESTEQVENEDYEPLSKQQMDVFAKDVMPGCLALLDALPQTVYRLCDLLLVASHRNGTFWTKLELSVLVVEISKNVEVLLKHSAPMTSSDTRTVEEWAMQLSQLPEATKAASRIHLFTLLFAEKKNQCAVFLEESNLIDSLVMLVDAAQNSLTLLKNMGCKFTTPKWLAPVVLLIDLYEKSAVASMRRAPLLLCLKRQWRWFDERSGKWNPYTGSNNKAIDDAYKAGEARIRISAGRRKYTIDFGTMIQMNEETGGWRAIMFLDASANPTKAPAITNSSTEQAMEIVTDSVQPEVGAEIEGDAESSEIPIKSASQSITTERPPLDIPPTELPPELAMKFPNTKEDLYPDIMVEHRYRKVKQLSHEQSEILIRACVSLLDVPVESDTLHAILRLVLRLTQQYTHAKSFAWLGGVRLLLQINNQNAFIGFISLATLIIRHVMEEPEMLIQLSEKVVRKLWSNSHRIREMNYQLRMYGPAFCRHTAFGVWVLREQLRIQLGQLTRREEDDLRLLQPNAVQFLRILPPKEQQTANKPTDVARELIADLLNALTVKMSPDEPTVAFNPPLATASGADVKPATRQTEQMDTGEPSEDIDLSNAPASAASAGTSNPSASTATAATAPVSAPPATSTSTYANNSVNPALVEQNKAAKIVLCHSSILRLLAELVRSYDVVPKLVTEHSFQAGSCELIQEDSTALSFILDHLLPTNQTVGDRDCPALVRVLIASLASCVSAPDAQTSLVAEVKSALNRSLLLPDSCEKHARIQALTGIISTMIESCPNTEKPSVSMPNLPPLPVNPMVKIMHKKGILTDLARVSHSLDLSSPHMAVTINSVLKPLETLSRIINNQTRQFVMPASNKNKTNTRASDISGSNNANASNTTNANPSESEFTGTSSVTSGASAALNVFSQNEIPNISDDVTASILPRSANEMSNASSNRSEDPIPAMSNQASTAGNTDTSLSDTHAFADVHVDDNTDNEAVVIDEAVAFDMYNESRDLSVNESNASQILEIIRDLARDSHETEEEDGHDDDEDDIEDEEDGNNIQVARRGSGRNASNVVDINEVDTDSDESDDSDDDDDDDEEEEQEEPEENSAAEDEEPEDDDDEDEEHAHAEDDDDEEQEDREVSDRIDLQSYPEFMMRINERETQFFLGLEDMFQPSVLSDGMHLTALQPMLDNEANSGAADATQPILPPPPGTVLATHPLLARHAEIGAQPSTGHAAHGSNSTSLLSRQLRATVGLLSNEGPGLPRTSRTNALGRSNATNGVAAAANAAAVAATANAGSHRWHLPANNHMHLPNPPVLLQRLLGPTSNDILQMSGFSAVQPARVLLASNDLQYMNDDWNEYNEPAMQVSSAISSIPNTAARWIEESKVLDGESMHDLVAWVRPAIVKHWESLRDLDIEERKVRRNKHIRGEAAAKKESQDKRSKAIEPTTDLSSQANATTSDSVEVQMNQEENNEEVVVESILQPNEESSNDANQPMQTTSADCTLISENNSNSSSLQMQAMELGENSAQSETLPVVDDNEMVEIACPETIAEPDMEVGSIEPIDVPTTAAAEQTSSETAAPSEPQLITSEILTPEVELPTPEPNNVVEITQSGSQPLQSTSSGQTSSSDTTAAVGK